MEFTDNTLAVSVKDDGNGFKELPEEPDIKQQIQQLVAPRGLGIYLIKRLVDQVEFQEITSGGHVVKMAIKLTR
jgi:anti-sigma regulatory factor (Ser/Thr protein kinase)